ncbi:MAG: hypothetical protein F9K43_13375, partial [Bauldia sp.]
MREIIFDTETTGLDAREDRVIEFGGVELVNRFPTGRYLHCYINPQGRPVHPDALAVHGISDADLVGKPTFPEVAEELVAFLDGAMLVAHNANFDIGFLDAEFARLGLPPVVWWALLYLAVGPTAICFYLIQFATHHLPAAKVIAY